MPSHFHRTLRDVCAPFDAGFYPRFKRWCDDYFFLPHRQEPRGVGGVFFDYLGAGAEETAEAAARPGCPRRRAVEADGERLFAFVRGAGRRDHARLPADRRAPPRRALGRARAPLAAPAPRPLRRVQPDLRSRDPVRPQDRRADRVDPDVPAARGALGVRRSRPSPAARKPRRWRRFVRAPTGPRLSSVLRRGEPPAPPAAWRWWPRSGGGLQIYGAPPMSGL